jgi:hypothetical protein
MEKTMTDNAPVEGNEVKAKTQVSRAKPLVEIEAERKAADAARARTVGRASPLVETGSDRAKGDPNKMVTCRVLNKGEGRIQTGSNPPEFYAAGAHFEVSEPSALQLEARGYAERTRD